VPNKWYVQTDQSVITRMALQEHLTVNFQTPPDGVVKFQPIDIVDIILQLVLRPRVVSQRESKG